MTHTSSTKVPIQFICISRLKTSELISRQSASPLIFNERLSSIRSVILVFELVIIAAGYLKLSGISANGSWLMESTLSSQHDIKMFFDLEIYLSTFNSLKHLKVHLTIMTIQKLCNTSKTWISRKYSEDERSPWSPGLTRKQKLPWWSPSADSKSELFSSLVSFS